MILAENCGVVVCKVPLYSCVNVVSLLENGGHGAKTDKQLLWLDLGGEALNYGCASDDRGFLMCRDGGGAVQLWSVGDARLVCRIAGAWDCSRRMLRRRPGLVRRAGGGR